MTDHRIGLPSRFERAVRGLDGDFYMRKEVRALLDISDSTLHLWGRRNPRLAAQYFIVMEGRRIYLYSGEQLPELRAYQESKYPPGHKREGMRLWLPSELHDRRRRQRKIRYLRERAALHAGRGEENMQLKLIAYAEIVQRRLDAERAERREELGAGGRLSVPPRVLLTDRPERSEQGARSP